MTAVETITRPEHTTTSEDRLSHFFCQDQRQAWGEGKTATARCGKTKQGWVPARGQGLTCVVCIELSKAQQCAHCNKQTTGSN